MTKVRRSSRAALVSALTLAIGMLAVPGSALASFTVRASAHSFVFFSGDQCGSASVRSLQLPHGAREIKPTALPVGSVLRSLDDDVTPVARITDVTTDPATRTIRWTATGSDASCAADPLDAELGLSSFAPWETNGNGLDATYSKRVSRVYLPAKCQGPQYRPGRVIVACGDGNLQLTALRWKGWNRRAASARGVALMNDCVPYCAAGHFRRFPVAVRVSQPAQCRGVYQYLHLRYRLLRAQRGFSRTGTTSYDWTCDG